jgi:hypothetical protein
VRRVSLQGFHGLVEREELAHVDSVGGVRRRASRKRRSRPGEVGLTGALRSPKRRLSAAALFDCRGDPSLSGRAALLELFSGVPEEFEPEDVRQVLGYAVTALDDKVIDLPKSA